MNETTTPTEALVPVEEQIQQELVRHNVTEKAIADIREKFLPLKIKDLDDKETYLEVKEARKGVKALRVLAKKICVAGREEANAISKAWVAKEKDLTGRIGEVEDHLEKQEKEFEAAIAAEKERKKRQQDEQLILRQQILTGMGALYSDGSFTLGEVSFEMSLIRECDPGIWESDIKPKFEEEYRKVEADRLEQERIKQEREAEMRRQQEELERKQRELFEKEAALKAIQEEQERKQREEYERQAAATRAEEEARNKARIVQLQSLGLRPHMEGNTLYYVGYSWAIASVDMTGYSEDQWSMLIEKATADIAAKKEEEERERLAEIEAQKEAERISALRKERLGIMKQYGASVTRDIDLGTYNDDSWAILLEEVKAEHEKQQRIKWGKEQEEKRKADELKKQQEMEQAKDKEKWAEMSRQVNAIEVFEMRSSQYRTKAMKFRQKLDELKAIIDG